MYTTAMSWRAAGRRVAGPTLLGVAIACACHPIGLSAQTPRPAIVLALSRHGDRHRSSIVTAAEESGARYTEWLGPAHTESLVITEQPVADRSLTSATVSIHVPWLTSPEAMEIESQVAYGVAMAGWSGVEPGTTTPVAESLSWYLQSRIVERLFNLSFGSTSYSAESTRLFGGAVPRAFRTLRLSRWSAGLGRDWLIGESSDRPARRLPEGVTAAAIRGALAFGTVERWLGWPVLQGGLWAVARQADQERLRPRDAIDRLSAAVGQDLWWLFDAAFDSRQRFDYAIERVRSTSSSTRCGQEPCVRSEVTLSRRGQASFSGSARAPQDGYESGAGLVVRVTFSDGQTASASWDGLAAERTIIFDAPAAAASVTLDPDRTVLLEASPLDLRRAMAPESNVPLGKWVARWAIWLQDAALAYTALL